MVKLGLQATALTALTITAIIIWTLGQLPDSGTFPIHWNAAGEPNGFADKKEFTFMMWSLAGVTVFCGLLFAALPKIAPHKTNLMKSSKAYLTAWIGLQIIMTFTIIIVSYSVIKGIQTGSGDALDVSGLVKVLFFSISIFFIIIGNYLPKTRPNWFIGIRTPWSLSSQQSWEKTHRLAGLLFVIFGASFAGLIWLFPLETAIYMFLAGQMIAAFVPVIASYQYWKHADDKIEL